ncbi:MAG: hypothetical protein A2X67_12050 [Ignavibacteria bacterium GWA2_55_11]|nr:MAG: hypothetical protein A2X67_12050 [Ignavibacteria bacterium GWA2_55_11]OGU62412.1 MAG: hypothetical protein A3C56_07125 [Ignavibacteria bacterium RIFCSPHIGHO2_02_FULL_56_12]OGU70048.1 MAG: hypothetical protein A3H45_06385 [Ignavibacteria bacterium RIFCSPLOWO2_02_FULL_55_14]
MPRTPMPDLVSVHGGHSGEFCSHAKDTLEAIIQAYVRRNFRWVGITEHMPPLNDAFLYIEERETGLNSRKSFDRFSTYVETCRRLREKYASSIKIFVGFETEWYTGSADLVHRLVDQFEPDYIVGSLHHVDDILIDGKPELFWRAVETLGSVEALYCRYFDQQLELINALRPSVIGHFDLIRMHDPDYAMRWDIPEIQWRIRRNLKRIKELELILDFNVAALRKGALEPYISRPILLQALDLGISVVPGDDSHGVDSVGLQVEEGIKILLDAGFTGQWAKPVVTRS